MCVTLGKIQAIKKVEKLLISSQDILEIETKYFVRDSKRHTEKVIGSLVISS